ncbi:MAG: LmeA family phospholipid-binding protein [Leptolyngbyaceae cyanobacterium SL_1_1]|nr:LmeA family phospholipid-binding protein [Leptolyngbyaceae cyanobacterium SL_1_1]
MSINPLKTVTGEIELEQSVAAKTAVVLTAADIEQALNSEYIQTKLSNLQIRVAGQKTYIKPHQIKFSIPQTDTIWVEADIELVETGEIQQVGFKAQPRMTDSGHQVVLENVELLDAAKEQPELTEALVEVVTELLDLDNFELEDMSLRFERIGVEPGQIKLQAKAKIDSLPA